MKVDCFSIPSNDQKYNVFDCDLLILSRYPANFNKEPSYYKVYASLSLLVLAQISSFKPLYEKITKKIFSMTSQELSDLCVEVFDTSALDDLYDGSASYAFRLPDGRVIHQHST